jgi:hypothetical protein
MSSRKGENCCVDVTGDLTSREMDIYAVINNEVGMSSSQYQDLKKGCVVSANISNISSSRAVGGPGDYISSGWDKKHNSYERYLARKKGKLEFYSGRRSRLEGFTMLGSNGYLC